MDKDQVKGTMDDAAGRIKRQAGEWTGDTKTQADGAAQQVKGKAEKAWGNAKEAVRNADKERTSHTAAEDVDRKRSQDDMKRP
ncbi:MAG TPA: CsbD family protein [Terracidiphilus sp.]|jgi:uncharacterized protein YjbJ (UPF0337 family)|nr:CsbD family protein [Terracidiphilus sp.]